MGGEGRVTATTVPWTDRIVPLPPAPWCDGWMGLGMSCCCRGMGVSPRVGSAVPRPSPVAVLAQGGHLVLSREREQGAATAHLSLCSLSGSTGVFSSCQAWGRWGFSKPTAPGQGGMLDGVSQLRTLSEQHMPPMSLAWVRSGSAGRGVQEQAGLPTLPWTLRRVLHW